MPSQSPVFGTAGTWEFLGSKDPSPVSMGGTARELVMSGSESLFLKILTTGGRLFYRVRQYVRFRIAIIPTVFVASVLSFWLAYELRFDFNVPDVLKRDPFILAPLIALMKTAVFVLLKGHTADWRYTGVREAERVLMHGIVSSGLLCWFSVAVGLKTMPRGVILADFFVTSLVIGGFLLGLRLVREHVLALIGPAPSRHMDKTVIFGAGDGGEMLVREIVRNRCSGMTVKAFFDDDPRKHGAAIHGISVLGGLDDVSAYIAGNAIESVIVAIPSADRELMTRIHDSLRDTSVKIKVLPPLAELVNGAPKLEQLRDINIADLLGRREVKINSAQVSDLIRGKIVAITGAGGSIGSELCRQILQRHPAKMVLMERSENGLFHIHRHLAEQGGPAGTALVPVLCDITNESNMLDTFRRHLPNLVFHAAAHKHVGLQEQHPAECFRNNVGGTGAVARAADAVGVELFLMISTDKAVNPTSVMGATKRVCEIYCQAMSHISDTRFVAVRFGNVLGSEGSVVNIFMEQIGRGGPLTITHPDMQRYFMTIPEAVMLVLQAAALGESGQVLVLDMGRPVKVLDLARQLVRLMHEGDCDVPIEFIGPRPGEKLFEELTFHEEMFGKSAHESIKVFLQNGMNWRNRLDVIEKAVRIVCADTDDAGALRALARIVPEYRPSEVSACVMSAPSRTEALPPNGNLRVVTMPG
ncbi:MAG: nucleoside-diphosphate sugar epimerase/dehydratase [Pseudomonadota bacterium]